MPGPQVDSAGAEEEKDAWCRDKPLSPFTWVTLDSPLLSLSNYLGKSLEIKADGEILEFVIGVNPFYPIVKWRTLGCGIRGVPIHVQRI